MRVLYITNAAQIGGANRSLQTLWEGLHNYEIEPYAVCPEDGPMVSLCREARVPVTILPYLQPSWRHPYQTFQGYQQWRHVCSQVRPTLIHANDFSNARSVILAAKSLHLPVVCHIRFHAAPEYLRWVFRGLPKPSAFIHNSEATRQLCGPILSEVCPRAQQSVIHNCVSLGRFTPPDTEVPVSRPLRVGIVANLIPLKGHMDFLEMACLLSKREIKAEYWIIGEDIHQSGYRQQLEQRQRELGLKDVVKFLGHRLDIPDLLQQMDVLVCASHVEPFGICSIEGMACALPVVGTRVGGIPEVIDDGVTGYLVAPHTPHELAEKVEGLLMDPSLRKRMGQAGRMRVEHLFSYQAHTSKIVNLYYKVL